MKPFTTRSIGSEFVAAPEEADVILIWIKPSIRPLFPANDAPLEVNLSSCAVDTDHINQLTGKKHSILVVNYSNPFATDEVYDEETKGRL